MPYPVTFEADYPERQSRLTAFFRLLLAIPILIWVYIYGIVASIAVVIAWFALVITAHYPKGLYDLVEGYTRLLARATAYTFLLCDPYPPFSGRDDPRYPVRMHFAGPLPHYSRLKAFFRFLLAIPILIARYAIAILMEIGAIAAWITVVILGRMPSGLWEVMVLGNSFTARSDAYLFLLTETYPPFSDEPALPGWTRQELTDRPDLPGTSDRQLADTPDPLLAPSDRQLADTPDPLLAPSDRQLAESPDPLGAASNQPPADSLGPPATLDQPPREPADPPGTSDEQLTDRPGPAGDR